VAAPRHVHVVERTLVTTAPTAERNEQRLAIAPAGSPAIRTPLSPGVAHPARTRVDAGEAELPATPCTRLRRGHDVRPVGKIAPTITMIVLGIGIEITTGNANAEWGVLVRAGHGTSKGSTSPGPLSP
jgi:hypothetical protein